MRLIELAFIPSKNWTVFKYSCFVTWQLKLQTSNITTIVKMTIFYVDICLKLFLQPVNRIVHYAVLEFSHCEVAESGMGCVHTRVGVA